MFWGLAPMNFRFGLRIRYGGRGTELGVKSRIRRPTGREYSLLPLSCRSDGSDGSDELGRLGERPAIDSHGCAAGRGTHDFGTQSHHRRARVVVEGRDHL